MSLPEFKNEAEFRKEWIAPFLAKLGYILPKHVHGANEQGKDFYFAEHDKFGHLRFCAAQVKLGKIGSGQTELDNLLNQVRRSFTVTLKYHKGADRQRISSVYIMTNESISDGAREYISDWCRSEHYGENVFYLDGETLESLERHATYIDDKILRIRLVALLNEAHFNLGPIQTLSQSVIKGEPVFQPCRTLALEDVLRNPLPEDILAYEYVSNLWENLNEINKRNVPYQLEFNERSLWYFTQIAESTFNLTVKMRDIVSGAITKVDSQYSLEIEIEEQ
ncbi:hypothetical protein CA11_53120 [Gimesia maris]|uniref:hypothetical protein n=1 Tax=Gimesia maris TaxID=122 RepID=UPI0011884566|nr:hypothetical protein [Gimesia maris]QDU17470.1 hypothetical protein CA11_53120 [Gimesia maris]